MKKGRMSKYMHSMGSTSKKQGEEKDLIAQEYASRDKVEKPPTDVSPQPDIPTSQKNQQTNCWSTVCVELIFIMRGELRSYVPDYIQDQMINLQLTISTRSSQTQSFLTKRII